LCTASAIAESHDLPQNGHVQTTCGFGFGFANRVMANGQTHGTSGRELPEPLVTLIARTVLHR
jgi:hypothetical protein